MKVLNNLFQLFCAVALVAFVATGVEAQDDKNKRKSPPMETTGNVGDAQVTINYSAPSVNGRSIFGDLVPYGEIWRTGANEATTMEVSKKVMIDGHELAAGKYALLTIPGEDKWTIVFNADHDQWGAYNYDQSKDVLRVEVDAKTLDKPAEQLTIGLKEHEGTSWVSIKWAGTKAAFSVAAAASN